MKKKRSLKRQLISMLVIAIILPIIAISVYSSYNIGNILDTQFKGTISDNVNWISQIVKQTNKSNIESVNMLSQDPNALEILKNPDCEKWLGESFKSFLSTHKDVMNVYYGLSNGKMILQPEDKLPEGFDPRKKDWYSAALKSNGQVIITDPYEDSVKKGTYEITFAKAVNDSQSGQVIGVIGIDIKLATIADSVSKLKIGEGGYAAILDKTGTIIAHKNSDVLGKTSKDEKWIDDVIASKSQQGTVTIGGQKFLTYSADDKDTGWKIIGFVPEKEITNKINSNRIGALKISLIFLILAVILGYLFANSITKSISKLADVLNKISDGDYTVKVEKDKKVSYEIEMISNSINKMIYEMATVLEGLLQTSEGMKESSESLVSITQESNAVGEEVSKAVQQIAGGASEQAANLDEGAVTVKELGDEISNAIEYSKTMMVSSENVKMSTEEGTKVIENLKQTFAETSGANRELQEQIRILAESSNRISTITDTIKSITEQTSLLALNASIEAARAGEAGRGFAVVAEEVRKLAEQSSRSALEINKVIEEIKNSVSSVLQKIDLSINTSKKSEESVHITNETFMKIEEAMVLLEENINMVNASLREINRSKDKVTEKITEVSTVAQETAATAEEVSASSEEQSAGLNNVVASAEQLSMLAENLDEMVRNFKL